MEILASFSDSGQITIPAEIRKILNLKSGDEIIFYINSNGEIMINKAPTEEQEL